MVLPYGNLTLWAGVADQLGAETLYMTAEVIPLLPSQALYKEYQVRLVFQIYFNIGWADNRLKVLFLVRIIIQRNDNRLLSCLSPPNPCYIVHLDYLQSLFLLCCT